MTIRCQPHLVADPQWPSVATSGVGQTSTACQEALSPSQQHLSVWLTWINGARSQVVPSLLSYAVVTTATRLRRDCASTAARLQRDRASLVRLQFYAWKSHGRTEALRLSNRNRVAVASQLLPLRYDGFNLRVVYRRCDNCACDAWRNVFVDSQQIPCFKPLNVEYIIFYSIIHCIAFSQWTEYWFLFMQRLCIMSRVRC